jgi:hypothetical protein
MTPRPYRTGFVKSIIELKCCRELNSQRPSFHGGALEIERVDIVLPLAGCAGSMNLMATHTDTELMRSIDVPGPLYTMEGDQNASDASSHPVRQEMHILTNFDLKRFLLG